MKRKGKFEHYIGGNNLYKPINKKIRGFRNIEGSGGICLD